MTGNENGGNTRGKISSFCQDGGCVEVDKIDVAMGGRFDHRIRVGQRWQDNDKRSRNRVIEITNVDATHVDAKIVSDDLGPQRIGRNTRIAKTRLKPTSTGYRLLTEPAPAGDFYACPKPDCDTPRDQPGDCPVHEIPLLHIGPDGHEVTP